MVQAIEALTEAGKNDWRSHEGDLVEDALSTLLPVPLACGTMPRQLKFRWPPTSPCQSDYQSVVKSGTSGNPPAISAPQLVLPAPEPTSAEAQTTPIPATPVAPVPLPEAITEQASQQALSEELTAAGSEDKKKPTYYFEFAKRKWETEETFRLPDGTFWPQVGLTERTHVALAV